MPLERLEMSLPEVLVFQPQVFGDHRGFFLETYHRQKYAELGLTATFVQDNLSRSKGGILRGLHYQLRRPQGKFVFVIRGEIFDVAVDIRRGSPTFGKWVGVTLSEENHKQIYVPPGFAHGFCVLSESADVMYKVTDHYGGAADDFGIMWNDPQIGIPWPIQNPTLSDKDTKHPTLATVNPENLPV